MRQVKKRKSMPSPPVSKFSIEEEMKNIIKGKNDQTIAMNFESITDAIDTVKALKQQDDADKAAKAALAKRMTKSDKATQDLLCNHKIMQKNLAAATRSKDTDQEFGKIDIKPIKVVEALPTHKKAYRPTKVPSRLCQMLADHL